MISEHLSGRVKAAVNSSTDCICDGFRSTDYYNCREQAIISMLLDLGGRCFFVFVFVLFWKLQISKLKGYSAVILALDHVVGTVCDHEVEAKNKRL